MNVPERGHKDCLTIFVFPHSSMLFPIISLELSGKSGKGWSFRERDRENKDSLFR